MYLRFLQVLINAQVDDLYSYNTKYTSPALTQKVFANMRRIGKDFLGVETPLFATMLVQPQAAAEDEDDNEVSAAPTPPSPTQAPSPPPPEPTSPPPHPQPVPPLSPLQEQPTQPTHTSESSMNLLNTLIKTYASLTQKVANLEQDKEGGIVELDADEDVTLVDVDTTVETDADIQGRMEEDVNAVKEINAAEPTVFDDEEMAKRLQDEELKADAREALPEFKEETNLCSSSQEKHDSVFEENGWGTRLHTLRPGRDEEPTKKRGVKETLLQESFKKLREEVEASGSHTTQQDTPTVDPTEIFEEDV
nr:hypothetical protein [Tanacetum cinerariifolium]